MRLCSSSKKPGTNRPRWRVFATWPDALTENLGLPRPALFCRKGRPMDENLIGYLLNALDSDTRLETEKYLLRNPDARDNLDRLRSALEPLETDRNSIDPPPGLWARTLARVAEF